MNYLDSKNPRFDFSVIHQGRSQTQQDEESSILNDFNKDFLKSQQQNTFRLLTFYFQINYLKNPAQSSMIGGPFFGTEQSPALYDSSIQKIQQSGIQSRNSNEPDRGPAQILAKIIQLVKETFSELIKATQITQDKQIAMLQLVGANDESQIIKLKQELQGLNNSVSQQQSSLQNRYETIMKAVSDCSNSFMNIVAQNQTLENSQYELRKLKENNQSRNIDFIYSQVYAKDFQKFEQQIIDLKIENSKLHALLKNRESIQLSLNKKSEESIIFMEDEKIVNLEKDKLNKKILRLQKRLEEDQDYYLQKRKEFAEREKDLLLQKDHLNVKIEEKDQEIQEFRDQLEQQQRQTLYLNEQIKLLERDDRRKNNTDNGPLTDIIRSLKSQVKQLQEDKKSLMNKIQQQKDEINNQIEEISDLNEKIAQFEVDLQKKEDQIQKIMNEKEIINYEKMQHQQNELDLKNTFSQFMNEKKRIEKEILDLKKQLDSQKKVIKEQTEMLSYQEAQYEQMRQNLDVKEDQVVQLMQDYQVQQNNIDQLQSRIQQIKDDYFKLQLLNKSIDHKLQDKEIQLQIFKKEELNFESKSQAMNIQYNQQLQLLTEKLNEQQQQAYQISMEYEELQIQLRQNIEENSNSRDRILKLQSEKQITEAEVGEKDEIIKQLQEKIKQKELDVKDQFIKLKEKLLLEVEEKEKLDLELENVKQKFTEKIEEERTKAEYLNQELVNQKQLTERLQQEEKKSNKSLKQRNIELQQQVQQYQIQIVELQAQLKDRNQEGDNTANFLKLDHTQAEEFETSKLREELLFQQQKNEKNKIELKARDKRLIQADQQLRNEKQSKEDLEKELHQFNLKYQQLQLDLKRKISEQELKIKDFEDQVSDLTSQNKEITMENEKILEKQQCMQKDMENKVKEMRQQLQTKEEKSNQMRKLVEELQKKNGDLLEEVNQQKSKNEKEQQEYIITVMSLKEKIQTLNSAIKEMLNDGKSFHLVQKVIEELSRLMNILEELSQRKKNSSPQYSFDEIQEQILQ